MNDDLLYTQSQIAELMHVSTKTLESMRQKGTGPRYSKFGRRVLYSQSSIDKFLHDRTYSSTSEYQRSWSIK